MIRKFRILVNSANLGDMHIRWRLPGVRLIRHSTMPKALTEQPLPLSVCTPRVGYQGLIRVRDATYPGVSGAYLSAGVGDGPLTGDRSGSAPLDLLGLGCACRSWSPGRHTS